MLNEYKNQDNTTDIESKEYYHLDNLRDGFHFEEYTAELLKALDFQEVEVLQRSNDYGADVLAKHNGVKYAIQCKYYTSATVGVSAVQEILGGTAYHNAHVSVVATNYRFTPNAINLAKANNVVLWDRTDLLEMSERAGLDDLIYKNMAIKKLANTIIESSNKRNAEEAKQSLYKMSDKNYKLNNKNNRRELKRQELGRQELGRQELEKQGFNIKRGRLTKKENFKIVLALFIIFMYWYLILG